MPLEEIKSLPINKIANKNCALFLWATLPKLREAFEVIDSWGFKYITAAFVWLKTNPKNGEIRSGVGYWTNSNVEMVLFAKKGAPKRIAKNVKQVIVAPIQGHSRKPDEVRDRIEALMGETERIELFATKRVENWDCIGFAIDGKDIRDSLEGVINA